METVNEHHQEQGDVAPAQPSLEVARARQVTASLRQALDDVRRSVAVLAARVRQAHSGRVWAPLGYGSWEAFCAAEFGISRAQAYRLLDVADALAAIDDAVTVGAGLSRTRDTADEDAAAAALDYGLSQRALVAVAARPDDVADLITARLAALTHDRAQALDDSAVHAVVHQAVQDVRSSPPPSPVDRPADPALAALRRTADGLAASAHLIGQLMLEVAPEHLSEAAAADVLAPLCEAIGEDLQHALASRRYVICGDRRALYGTVL